MSFERKEDNEANGGKTYPMDMSTTEYSRKHGSDGFSKTGSSTKVGSHSHHYESIKKDCC